jgi:hypothetical protein
MYFFGVLFHRFGLRSGQSFFLSGLCCSAYGPADSRTTSDSTPLPASVWVFATGRTLEPSQSSDTICNHLCSRSGAGFFLALLPSQSVSTLSDAFEHEQHSKMLHHPGTRASSSRLCGPPIENPKPLHRQIVHPQSLKARPLSHRPLQAGALLRRLSSMAQVEGSG